MNNILPKITVQQFDDHYTQILDFNEIVKEDWCYSYDLCFVDSPFDPDMRVMNEWVGKKIKECKFVAKEFFYKPIINFEI